MPCPTESPPTVHIDTSLIPPEVGMYLGRAGMEFYFHTVLPWLDTQEKRQEEQNAAES